jgi:hypothetical protein
MTYDMSSIHTVAFSALVDSQKQTKSVISYKLKHYNVYDTPPPDSP